MLAVKIEQIAVVAADWFFPEKGQQIFNIFLGLLDVVEGEDVEIIEVEIVVDFLQRLQYQKGVFCLVFDLRLFRLSLFFSFGLTDLLLDDLGGGVDVGSVGFNWGLGTVIIGCFGLEKHQNYL